MLVEITVIAEIDDNCDHLDEAVHAALDEACQVGQFEYEEIEEGTEQ